MNSLTVKIGFPNESPDKAGALVESLASDLRREIAADGKRLNPDIKRTDATAQDFGTVLALVLGTPSIIMVR